MREVEQLLAAIRAAPPRAGATRIVAVDGRSGAGKSTLAAALAHGLPAALVALEDLYGGWDGLEDGVSRLCTEVLAPLAEGRAAIVPRYDWQAGVWLEPATLEPAETLIVEGVGAGALAWRRGKETGLWQSKMPKASPNNAGTSMHMSIICPAISSWPFGACRKPCFHRSIAALRWLRSTTSR